MFIPRHVDLHWELLKWAAILSLAVATAMAFAKTRWRSPELVNSAQD